MVSRTTGVRTTWTSLRSPRVAPVAISVRSEPHPMLRVEQSGPVVTITLDSPQRRNAQAPSLWSALAEVGEGLDESVRVVMVRAEGPSFSAGLDRAMLTPQGAPGEPGAIFARAGGGGVGRGAARTSPSAAGGGGPAPPAGARGGGPFFSAGGGGGPPPQNIRTAP